MIKKFALLGLAAASSIASAITIDTNVDVTGIRSYEGLGNALNVVVNLDMDALYGNTDYRVIGIGWDVTLFADTPSWLSEMAVNFGSSTTGAVNLAVGTGDDTPGVQSYTSGGVVDLVGLGLDFDLNADEVLRMEFFETFNDFANDWDGEWRSGTITVRTEAVPEPASMLALGAGAAVLIRRRKK